MTAAVPTPMTIPRALFARASSPAKARAALAILALITRNLIGTGGECRLAAAELARLARMDPASISRCLALLEAVGAIRRERTRRKRKVIAVTRAGALPLIVTPRRAARADEWNTEAFFAAPTTTLEEVRRHLAAGCPATVTDAVGFTPLHWAAHLAWGDLVPILVAAGADVEAVDQQGQTPLHVAIGPTKRHVRCVAALLNVRADPNTANVVGQTPLHLAAARGSPDVLAALVTAGGDPNARDDSDRTVRDWARTHAAFADTRLLDSLGVGVPDNWNTVEFFATATAEDVMAALAAGARIEVQDDEGLTPLHLAAGYGPAESVQVLLDHRADIGARNTEGQTPLHLAAENDSAEVLQALVAAGGVDHAARDADGWTPLHVAAAIGSPEGVKILLDAYADREARDHVDRTPLHLAALYGNATAILVLLGAGANRAARTKGGRTPLALAQCNDDEDSQLDERILDLLAP